MTRERGQVPEKVAERIFKDQELFDKNGLKLDTDSRDNEEEEPSNANPKENSGD